METIAEPLHRESDKRIVQHVEGSIKDPLKEWLKAFEAWGQRVRDDIMALEDAVIDLAEKKKIENRPFLREKRHKRYEQKHPGGDPGDPPGDPWEGA